MKLVIEKTPMVNVLFIKWLVQEIRNRLTLNIDVRKINRLQLYLEENFPETRISLLAALRYSLGFLRFRDNGRYYLIYLDVHNKLYRGIPLEDIVKFIDNGNLEIDGCQLFSRTFMQVEQELPELLQGHSFKGGMI